MGRRVVLLSERENIDQLRSAGIFSDSWLRPAGARGVPAPIVAVSLEDLAGDDTDDELIERNFLGVEKPVVAFLQFVDESIEPARAVEKMTREKQRVESKVERLTGHHHEGIKWVGILVNLDRNKQPQIIPRDYVEGARKLGGPIFLMGERLSASLKHRDVVTSKEAWPTAVSLLLTQLSAGEFKWQEGDVLAWKATGYRAWAKEATLDVERSGRQKALEFIDSRLSQGGVKVTKRPEVGDPHGVSLDLVPIPDSARKDFLSFRTREVLDSIATEDAKKQVEHQRKSTRGRRTAYMRDESAIRTFAKKCWESVRKSPLAPRKLSTDIRDQEVAESGVDGKESLSERFKKILGLEDTLASLEQDTAGCGDEIVKARRARLGYYRYIIAFAVALFFSYAIATVFYDALGNSGGEQMKRAMTALALQLSLVALVASMGAAWLMDYLEAKKGDKAVENFYDEPLSDLRNGQIKIARDKAQILADAHSQRSKAALQLRQLDLRIRLDRIDTAVTASLFVPELAVEEAGAVATVYEDEDGDQSHLIQEHFIHDLTTVEDLTFRGPGEIEKRSEDIADKALERWEKFTKTEDDESKGRLPLRGLVALLEEMSELLSQDLTNQLKLESSDELIEQLREARKEEMKISHPSFASWQGEAGAWDEAGKVLTQDLKREEEEGALPLGESNNPVLGEVGLVGLHFRAWKLASAKRGGSG